MIYGKRILVVLCIVAVLYFGIGSLIYPQWFLGLLWDAKFWSLSYWLNGLFYLFSEHTYAVIFVLVVALTLSAVTAKYRDQVWPFVDRVWLWLVASCLLAVFATALLVYRFERRQYESAVGLEASLAQLDAVMRNIGEVDHLRDLEPPIDFHYIDRDRVNSLYSELTPEMEESERKISNHSLVSGKAGVSGGAMSAEVGAAKGATTDSELKRTSSTPERKCIEIMKFVLSTKRSNYYTNGGVWFWQRILRAGEEQYIKARNDPNPPPITKRSLEALRLDSPPTKEQQEEARQRSEQYSQEFKNEIEALTGVVIVDGQFSIKQLSQDSLVVSEEYSEKPLHVVFKAVAPRTSELDKMLAMHSTRLKLFGTVVKPYGKDGIIELRPIAIF
jgi:hypothetical protein